MKKFASILLALLLAFSAFVACDNGSSTVTPAPGTSSDTTSGDTTSAVDTDAVTTEKVDDVHDLPADLKFEGMEFILGTYTGGNISDDWAFYLDCDEPEAGNLLEEAIFSRNSQIFEILGVEVTCKEDWNWTGASEGLNVAMSVCSIAGKEMYHGMFLESPITYDSLIIDELVYDIPTLPYVNLSKSYYNQQVNDLFYLRDNLYMVVGDFSVSVQNAAHWLVNNDMLIDLGYEANYLYDKVNNYDWTVADVLSMIENTYSDTNRDGNVDIGDTFGIAGACGSINPLYVSCGLIGTYLTDDGFAFDYGTDKSIEVFNMIMDMTTSNPDVYIDENYPAYSEQPWFNGRCLFHCNASELFDHKDLPFEFGVLPLPMYNDEQERYYCYGSGGAMIVPGNILDPDFVGASIEIFTALSAQSFKPAFYDYYMEQGVLRDDPSRENWSKMLNEWNIRDVVQMACPDSRLKFFDVVYQLLRDRDPGYTEKWDTQKTSIEETCWIFYEFYLKK